MKKELSKHGCSAATRKSDQGFTLLETSIALVVMMIVGLGAASLFVYAIGANTTARDRELAMAVAQQQLERLRNAEFSTLDATVTATGGASKTVESGGRQYTVATTIADTVAGDSSRKTVTVQVTPRGSTALTGVQRVFGGVTLVTIRSTDGVGPNLGS